MGVNIPPRAKYERKLTAVNKFRAGVYTVIAAMRLSSMQEEWSEWKGVGEKLKAAASAKRSAGGEEKRERDREVSKNEARKMRREV